MIDRSRRRERRFAQHRADRFEDGALGRLGCGQDLGAVAAPGRLERHIRKRAADIDAQPRRPAPPRPLNRLKDGQCLAARPRGVNPAANPSAKGAGHRAQAPRHRRLSVQAGFTPTLSQASATAFCSALVVP